MRARLRIPKLRGGIDHFLTRYADCFKRTRMWSAGSSLLFPLISVYDNPSNMFKDVSPSQLAQYINQKDKQLHFSFTRAINENESNSSKIDPSSVAFYSLL